MIDVAFSEGMLHVGPAPLTLLLDGTAWEGRQRKIAELISAAGRASGASTAFCFWSTEVSAGSSFGELDRFAEERRLRTKGRFVTPLVEGGCLSAGGSLVCFVAGRVPDWADWADCITPLFERRLVLGVSGHRPELEGCRGVAAGVHTPDDVARSVAELLLGERITSVEIRFPGCAPVCLPPDLLLAQSPRGLVLSWTGASESKDWELAFVSDGGVCRLELLVRGSEGSEVRRTGTVPSVRPRAAEWIALPETDARYLREALESYAGGTGQHRCSLCDSVHTFTSAFRCSEGSRSSGFYRVGGRLALPRCPNELPGRGVILHVTPNGFQALRLNEGPACWLGDSSIVRGADTWTQVLRDGSVATVLTPVWEGLYADASRDLWLVETRS